MKSGKPVERDSEKALTARKEIGESERLKDIRKFGKKEETLPKGITTFDKHERTA